MSLFNFKIITSSSDGETVASEVEHKYDGGATTRTNEDGVTVIAVALDGWRHTDEVFMGDLYQRGLIGRWVRHTS